MNMIMNYLPFLIPLVLIQLALMGYSLYHVMTHEKYRFGNRVIWILVCVLVNIIGPIIYLTVGRGEE